MKPMLAADSAPNITGIQDQQNDLKTGFPEMLSVVTALSTRIKDAGIAIRHSRKDILFLYCRVQKQI